MHKSKLIPIMLGLVFLFATVLSGCSGKGISGIFGGKGSGTAVVTGKVTLSSSIVGLGKPAMNKSLALQAALLASTTNGSGQLAVPADTSLLRTLNATLFDPVLANAQVDMYDADHPEWLFPVSSGSTDADGNYVLTKMTNASKNAGATYADGDDIPAGNYTLIAYSGFGLGQKPIVAVQSIVKNFDGTIPNVDFEVLPSDVAPEVLYMFGAKKNTDGTEQWGVLNGNVSATLPANSAIQVAFSMPMWRDSLKTGITIDPPVAGTWSLSADWLTATYYLDPGVQMTPGQTYTITINGEDSDPNLPRALNVYGNALQLTALGEFTAAAIDNIGPTVQWNSPTVIEMGQTVDVTQSFRIESNKPLDVNGITLVGKPSIGVKPGVLFLGKSAGGLYVYEFMLGEPLKLDTSYALTVSGGRDLAGHPINTLTGSVITKDAADTPGIDPNAAPEVQDLQAQVKSVFGKFVRSMNDRNIAQMQSVMSGEFYMEYDVASRGIDNRWDLNRDGRYSLGEFSSQLVTSNFPQWDYCGSTITGTISPAPGEFVNVDPLTNTADFSFKINAASTVTLSQCISSSPKDTFYMSLKFKNGGWKIVRGSVGIDTRATELSKPNLISNNKLTQSVYPFIPIVNDKEIVDGGEFSQVPDNTNLRAKFAWNSTPGVTVYVLILANERTPSNGFAIAFPSTVLAMSTTDDPIADLKGQDVGTKLGFSSTYANFNVIVGGKYRWEVIGLGTATATPDATNPNDPNFVMNKTPADIQRDISAVSTIKRFDIAGIFATLTATVCPGSSVCDTPVVYNPAIGYDLGNAFQATITIYTPNSNVPTAHIMQSAASRKYFDVTFTNRQATLTVPLYQGSNTFSIKETNVPAGQTALGKGLSVLTTGGKQRIITLWEVTDDLGNILNGDQWNYFTAPGAKKVHIEGAVSDPAITNIYYSLSNSSGSIPIASYGTVTTSGSGDNTFSTETINPPDIEIYNGNNFITLYQYIMDPITRVTNTFYTTPLIIYTDTGSVWQPPITISGITGAGTTTVTKTADYGTSSDWNVAAFDPAANYTVTVAGTFKTPGTGSYYVSSDGGYANGNLASDASGNFSLDALLWQGLSYVTVNDSQNNSYTLRVTAASGKPFNKPTITTIDGIPYNPVTSNNQYASANCYAVIQATADLGQMYVYWNGSLSGANYSESQNIQNTSGTFQFVVPLVGPGGTNNVTIYDPNSRRGSISITTTGGCAYSPPTFSLTSVTDPTGLVLTPSGTNYNSGSAASITMNGTSNRPYATVSAQNWVCGEYENYAATAAVDGSWNIPGIMVYGANGGWNSINLQMENQYAYYGVTSTNSASPVLRMGISSVSGDTGAVALTGGSCGYSYWDAGALNTTITVNGTTMVQSGTLNFTDTLNRQGQVQIVNGTFSIPNIPLFQGSNNTVNIYNYNDPQGYSSQYLSITSNNGVPKPRFVTITSPAQGATGVTGSSVTVSGTIADPVGSGYSGSNAYIYASVYACNTYKYYTSDTWMQTNYGYLPASVSASGFTINNVDFSTGCSGAQPAYIYVDIYDYNTSTDHYDQIGINGYGSETWNKPGMTKPGTGAATPQDMEMRKRAFQMMPK